MGLSLCELVTRTMNGARDFTPPAELAPKFIVLQISDSGHPCPPGFARRQSRRPKRLSCRFVILLSQSIHIVVIIENYDVVR